MAAPDSFSASEVTPTVERKSDPGFLDLALTPTRDNQSSTRGPSNPEYASESEEDNRPFFLRAWLHDVRGALCTPSGWKLVARGIAFVGGGFGVLIALLTYQDQVRAALADTAERSYARLVDDLEAGSETVRVSALRRIPTVMNRAVPASGQLTLWDGVRILLGGDGTTKALYHQEGQRLCHQFIKRAGAVEPAELEALRGADEIFIPTLPDSALTRAEFAAFLDLLVQLGFQGYYAALQPQHREGPERFAWVWEAPTHSDEEYPALTLFEGVRIESVDLRRLDLSGASFAHSHLGAPTFSFSILDLSSFARSIMPGADFDNTSLTAASFERAFLPGSSFADAHLVGCDFRFADLRQSSLRGAAIGGARFFGAFLDEVNLSGVRADIGSSNHSGGAFFQDASMRKAYLAQANLAQSQLERVTLDGAVLTSANLQECDLRYSSARDVDLSFANVRGAKVDLVDLSGANLTSIEGIEGLASCQDTNIANVTGLSEEHRVLLFSRGAVAIPNQEQWDTYKSAGRPHERWQEYAEHR